MRGDFIGCQDLRLKGKTLYNIKIMEGQVHKDPGEEWNEKKVERVLSKQFLVEHNNTYRKGSNSRGLSTSYINLILSLIHLKLFPKLSCTSLKYL